MRTITSRLTTLICLLSLATAASGASGSTASAAPQGGVFIPRNGGLEARLGQAHAFFASRSGGIMSLVSGEWPQFQKPATLDTVFTIKVPGTPDTQVRQSFDASPELICLEEGNLRIGLRVKFKLYDPQNRYYGHGMTETWLYPDGQVFITNGAALENMPAGGVVSAACIESPLPGGVTMKPSADSGTMVHPIPGRYLLLRGVMPNAGTPNLAVYWRTGKMEHANWVQRTEKGAPFYYRWPDYFIQCYLDMPQDRVGFFKDVGVSDGHLQLYWSVRNQQRTTGPKSLVNFFGAFRIAAVADEAAAKALVDAERQPVNLGVTGGVIHGNLGGYNDREGAYELRKTGDPMVVILPADPTGRTLCLKLVALSGHGAVTAVLDGQALVPQLSSDGGITDDPLAPIHEHPEAPADMAVVNVKLTDRPQALTVREQEGVQFVYQSRDPGRHIAVFSTKGGGTYASMRFSLADGHARNIRAYGHEDWALTENLFHWFKDCGYSPQDMLDQLRDFVIVKNGPDEGVFRYTSTNADDGARSEFLVSVPAAAPAMTMDVTATFTVVDKWPYSENQFFDVFPFRGVSPRDWWYDETLWLTRDGRWKTRRTVETTFEGDDKLETITGGGFFALYSSDRGNMLILTHHFSPELPTAYVICGNYIDYHMDVQFPTPSATRTPPPKGFQTSVQYELAIWGDKSVTRQQMIEIGKRSIAAQKLVLPP